MRGRPAQFDNDVLVRKAQQVFWEKGYTATSLDDLLQAMNIGSGSFYNTFKGGKKELFQKALQQRRTAFKEFQVALKESDAPVELIKDFFRSIARADGYTHKAGCIIANSVAELPFVDEELEQEAIAILKEVTQMFTAAIKKGQEEGTVGNSTEAAVLGKYLITLWNGLNVTRRMYPDRRSLARLIELQLGVLD